MSRAKRCLVHRIYCGIGDSISINPTIQVLASMFREVWICTPLPCLFRNIPEVKCLDPVVFSNLCDVPLQTMHHLKVLYETQPSHWFIRRVNENIFEGTKQYNMEREGKSFTDEGGNYYKDLMIGGNHIWRQRPQVRANLYVPDATPSIQRAVDLWLERNGFTRDNPLVFVWARPQGSIVGEGQTYWQERHAFEEEALTRETPSNDMLRRLVHENKERWQFVTAESLGPHLNTIFSQRDVPVLPLHGYLGLQLNIELLRRCKMSVCGETSRVTHIAHALQIPNYTMFYHKWKDVKHFVPLNSDIGPFDGCKFDNDNDRWPEGSYEDMVKFMELYIE